MRIRLKKKFFSLIFLESFSDDEMMNYILVDNANMLKQPTFSEAAPHWLPYLAETSKKLQRPQESLSVVHPDIRSTSYDRIELDLPYLLLRVKCIFIIKNAHYCYH